MTPQKPKRSAPELYGPQKITAALIRELAGTRPPKVKSRKDGKLKDQPKEILDSDNGLILRHQPSGALLLYVPTGRGRRERPFGRMCNAEWIVDSKHPLTLGQVKAESKRIRAEIVTGADFSADRKAARAVPTLKDFLKDDYGPWALKTNPDGHGKNLKDGQGALDRLKACFEKPFGSGA